MDSLSLSLEFQEVASLSVPSSLSTTLRGPSEIAIDCLSDWFVVKSDEGEFKPASAILKNDGHTEGCR